MELPRGMKDFEKLESSKIEYVRQKFIQTCNIFGYELMEPSPIELLSVLEAKSGSSIKDEIYYFKDKGDREVALRFDFTVGLARYAVSQKSMKLPAKLSSFGGVWRYDEPQKGRYRFFHQWDIEIFGKPSLEADAEIIEFTSQFFSELGLLDNIVIDISHRKLVESYINKIFSSNDSSLITDILRAIDKITKKPKDQILNEYEEKGYQKNNLEKILEFSELKGNVAEIEQKITTNELDGWNELKDIYNSLKDRGVNNIRINFGIVRGLDYYSGIVFEAFDHSLNIGSLVGGGRYDSLTSVFGRSDLGATGVAGGVERIVLSLENQNLPKNLSNSRISVLYTSDEMKQNAITLASKMRQCGLLVDVDLSGKPLKKQMELAVNSKFTIIVGPKEYEQNNVVLRNMIDRTEKTIPVKELLDQSSEYLS